jgi:hypothetical protein
MRLTTSELIQVAIVGVLGMLFVRSGLSMAAVGDRTLLRESDAWLQTQTSGSILVMIGGLAAIVALTALMVNVVDRVRHVGTQ